MARLRQALCLGKQQTGRKEVEPERHHGFMLLQRKRACEPEKAKMIMIMIMIITTSTLLPAQFVKVPPTSNFALLRRNRGIG